MPTLRTTLATAALAVALTAPLLAQGEPAPRSEPVPDTTADVLVLEHDFSTGVDEFARVFLEAKQVYRAELTSPDVTLRLRSLGDKVRPPRVYALVPPRPRVERRFSRCTPTWMGSTRSGR